MAIIIQLRRGTASQWASANPVLYMGEIVVETDTYQIKIGNGVTAYNSLGYAFSIGDPAQDYTFFTAT